MQVEIANQSKFNPMQMPSLTLPGLKIPLSRFIIGCDNKDSADEGAPVWEHWVEQGGRAFDTAFVYGGGKHEAAFGQWLKKSGMANDVSVIVKGAHTPQCLPDMIGKQLAQSLDRLQIDFAPIYIMHRDNLDVPVGEFVDALNALKSAGRIGIFGGSNWSVARFAQAAKYAASNNLQPPTILNNNLSLAVMEKPVWAGCISSNNASDLAYLRQHRVAHISWSSQARGYFLPEELRNRLPEDTRPETCFGSTNNEERRRRAEQLAVKYRVSPNNIAAAWVLSQVFPSFALVGPRNIAEINSTLPALAVPLTDAEMQWLNLVPA
jgi:aryl-alcohol dehydrogenase-like predicted oxidoreductase